MTPELPHSATSDSRAPWEKAQQAELKLFLALTPTEKFRLLVQAIEFAQSLRDAVVRGASNRHPG